MGAEIRTGDLVTILTAPRPLAGTVESFSTHGVLLNFDPATRVFVPWRAIDYVTIFKNPKDRTQIDRWVEEALEAASTR